MANFYISDTHIEHENVIRFDQRPFTSTKEMWRVIRDNWNNAVTNDDTVYIIGDFIWAKETEWAYYLMQLNGKKVLIRGNHDPKEFSRDTKRHFLQIKEYLEITDRGRHVILSHYPILSHKGSYNPDCYMLYGHVHNTREAVYTREARNLIRQRINGTRGEPLGQVLHVGCMEPYMNYTPRTLDEIIAGDAALYPRP